MESLCIVGGKGNMGRRYASICRFLGINHFPADVGDPIEYATHYVIATPTDTHLDIIFGLHEKFGKKISILCEKPFTTDPSEIVKLSWLRSNVYMVNNYAFYPGFLESTLGPTVYDFYNSGPHGLAWDCIQLLELASASVKLLNQSPIWQCQINGIRMQREPLDLAYVEMIRAFWTGKTKSLWGKDRIVSAHRKAASFLQTGQLS